MEAGISVSIQALGENTFLSANVRRIYTPPAPLAGRGGALKLVRGDAPFLTMSLHLPPSPSNLREKQLSEKFWKWARKVLDETPSRVVVPVLLLDANDISQTPWPEQIGKYSSKKKLHSTASAWENFCEIITCSGDFLWTLLQHSDRLCVSSCYYSRSQMLRTAPRRR